MPAEKAAEPSLGGPIKYPGVLWRQNLCNFELCTGSGSAPSSSHDLAEGEAALSRLDSCASQSDRPQFQ